MMRRVIGRAMRAALFCSLVAAAGCVAGRSPVQPDSLAGDSSVQAAAAAVCIDQTNALRASVGDPPLARSGQIDAFSNEAARVDGEAHQTHKYFLETNGGHGVALAENEIPWWKVSDWGSVENVVRRGVSQMWAEGAGGYHYVNMRGRYTEMGCGIAVLNGEVTVSQNFR